MTRDDMLTIVNYSIRGASTKAPLEDEGLDVPRRDVEQFYHRVAKYIENAIDNGEFDG
jgi:hypothetical protein